MRKLGCSISTIGTIALATVAELSGVFATAVPRSIASESPASLNHPSSSITAPGWLAQSNYWSDCRKVVQNYTQFYTTFPGAGGGLGTGVLNNGDRIQLLDGGQTYQGSDGRLYYRVSSPYRSSNPTIGYISVNASLTRCGHSARW